MDGRRPELLETIYATIGQKDAWTVIARQLAEFTNGAASIFAQGAPSPLHDEFTYGYEVGYLESYRRYYGALNGLVPFMVRQPIGTFLHCTAMPDRADHEQAEFVNDWAMPQGWEHHAMGLIDANGDEGVFLALARDRLAGGYTAEECRIMHGLMPHLQRALRFGLRVARLESLDAGRLGAFGALGYAAFSLTRSGAVLDTNERAEALVVGKAILRLRNGQVHSTAADGTERLLHAVRQVADSGIGRSVSLEGRPSALKVTLVPELQALPLSSARVASVLLLVKDPGAQAPDAAFWQETFRLTPAETRLLEAIVSGATIASYCEQAQLSRNTVKTQLKRLFAKTGTSRQPELVRLALGGGAPRPARPS